MTLVPWIIDQLEEERRRRAEEEASRQQRIEVPHTLPAGEPPPREVREMPVSDGPRVQILDISPEAESTFSI